MDLTSYKARNAASPEDALQEVYARVERYPDPAVWIYRLSRDAVLAQLRAATLRLGKGIAQPLLGVPFAVKDNMDVAGLPTTAACPKYAYVASRTATAVQRLLDAGAILIGKTNLDQFATGLVGVRSPYGACRNTFDDRYIAGGSSSGSAVAVAAGLVSFSLGTDTAGSGRVPAAFNNIVGLKPTRGLVSAAGIVPACRTLDCVSVFALTCTDACQVLEIIAGHDEADPFSRRAPLPWRTARMPTKFRFGVPHEDLEYFGNAHYAALYEDAIVRLRQLGGVPVAVDLEPFREAAALLYGGPWVAERYAAVKGLIESDPDALLPVTRTILQRAKLIGAVETFEAMYRLAAIQAAAERAWSKMDVMLLPTAGTIYTRAEVDADPIQLNTHLGTYTNFVNLLDCSAIAVPSGLTKQGLPFGVSLIASAWCDGKLWRLGEMLHRSTNLTLGATGHAMPSTRATSEPALPSGGVCLAVVGAHLSGQPLNWQLTRRGALLVKTCRTAAAYRLYALTHCSPPKPGLVRAPAGQPGAAIEVEVWLMSEEAFGGFVATIPAPLGIGVLALEDGTQVQGFICEPYGTENANDISHYGGWRAYLADVYPPQPQV
jgi:allophanate hydrolase